MPTLTRSDVHVNKPLGDIAIATQQDASEYICDKVFPIVPVKKQSDRYIVYNKDYWFRTGAQKRAPATESAGGGYKIDNTPTYYCDKWAYHLDVDDDTRENADDPIDMDRDATEFVIGNLLLRREKLFNARYMSPNTWGGLVLTNSSGVKAAEDFSPAIGWDNANSNPMQEVSKIITNVKRVTAKRINTMVVSDDANECLKQHPLVLNRLTYTDLKVVTEDLLAKLFGVDKYLVASAVENTAQEGAAGEFDFLMTNKFLLTYAAPNPGILKPTAGYIFAWAGRFGNSNLGTRMKTIRMEELEADRIEGEMCFDMHMISPELGVLGTNLIQG
ncbi:MAG: hypothetical protein EOO40_00180 [Deltaproteobacteria bacterium]|nr:MAG: hypothetical protein EOO40_00180 [Deltaproteobacteria bacterium]